MNKADEKSLVKLLADLEAGFLPYEVFKQIARLVVMPIIEFVPLRMKDGEVEVLLIKRSKHDDIWPNELHTPGTVIRATDRQGEMHKAFERILVDELACTAVSSPYYVGNLLHEGKRGAEQSQIFWVEVIGDHKVGTFHKADNLPEDTMDQQKKFIAQAVVSFKKNKNS